MTPQKGVCVTPASVTFRCLYNHFNKKGNQLFMYKNVVSEISPHRNGQTKMSRDQNGPGRNGQTEKSRTLLFH